MKLTTVTPLVLGLVISCNASNVMAEEAPVVDRSNSFVTAQTNSENNYYAEKEEELTEAMTGKKPVSHDSSSSHRNAYLLSELEELRHELNELRGKIEVQSHDLKLLKEEQLAFYKDLDSRLVQRGQSLAEQSKSLVDYQKSVKQVEGEEQKIESSKLVNKKKPDEQLSYAFAYEQIQSKHYKKALLAMNEYIENFPKGAYTANAYYWKGELLIKESKLENALQAFQDVITKFPDSTKVAPAMYKLGTTYALIGDLSNADKTLKDVMRKFPDTSTARLAESKLTKLNEVS